MASRDPLTRAQLDVALLRKALRDIATTCAPGASGLEAAVEYAHNRAIGAEASYLEDQEKRAAKDLTPLSHKEQVRKHWENLEEPST